jgi:16S rRNA (cytosine967-C5)-methyltransferase
MRKTALKILIAYEKEKSYINLLLKDFLKNIPDGRDRAFVTEAVYGVVRYKRYLDCKISGFSKTKINKLSAQLLNILRLGLYQLYFMDKTPPFAVINESVKLAEKFCYKSKGIVNAVLRNAANGNKEESTEMPFSVKYSFPDEIYSLIKEQYNERAEEILASLNRKKPTVIRKNPLKATQFDGGLFQNAGGYLIAPQFNPSDSDLWKNGCISVQSMASQAAVEVLTPREGEKILDACAAPGGKTAYIGEIMRNTGEITACEPHSHRCGLIEKNLKRCGVTNVKIINADASEISYPEYFDRIIVDAPCSGLGVIGNKPDIKWKKVDFGELVGLQYKILENCAKCLKKGGTLVYCTCTINKNENINQVNRFLNQNQEFSRVPFSAVIDGTPYGENGYAEIMPSENGIGFFIAKLTRQI